MERQATALEVLANYVRPHSIGSGEAGKVLLEEEDDYLITNDRDTYFRELDDSRRVARPVEEE